MRWKGSTKDNDRSEESHQAPRYPLGNGRSPAGAIRDDSQTLEEAAAGGKRQWTPPPPGSLRAKLEAASEKPLKQLLMEGFMEGIVTGVVADLVMSGTDNAESTRKRLASAYAKGFLDGKQLDWLAQRV